jgi:hypothetical protein
MIFGVFSELLTMSILLPLPGGTLINVLAVYKEAGIKLHTANPAAVASMLPTTVARSQQRRKALKSTVADGVVANTAGGPEELGWAELV